jgi:hypothetical protein
MFVLKSHTHATLSHVCFIRWVNNCVGVGNQKVFVLFVFYVILTCTYALLLVVSKYAASVWWHGEGGVLLQMSDSPRMTVHLIFLTAETALFLVYTLYLLWEQTVSISNNQTQIERLQNTKHKMQTAVNELFGTASHVKMHLSWLVPIPVCFPQGSTRDSVLGYRIIGGSWKPKGGLGENNGRLTNSESTVRERNLVLIDNDYDEMEGCGISGEIHGGRTEVESIGQHSTLRGAPQSSTIGTGTAADTESINPVVVDANLAVKSSAGLVLRKVQ